MDIYNKLLNTIQYILLRPHLLSVASYRTLLLISTNETQPKQKQNKENIIRTAKVKID